MDDNALEMAQAYGQSAQRWFHFLHAVSAGLYLLELIGPSFDGCRLLAQIHRHRCVFEEVPLFERAPSDPALRCCFALTCQAKPVPENPVCFTTSSTTNVSPRRRR